MVQGPERKCLGYHQQEGQFVGRDSALHTSARESSHRASWSAPSSSEVDLNKSIGNSRARLMAETCLLFGSFAPHTVARQKVKRRRVPHLVVPVHVQSQFDVQQRGWQPVFFASPWLSKCHHNVSARCIRRRSVDAKKNAL